MAFYTIKGHRFGKRMTPNHTGVNTGANRHRKAQLTRLIEELPLGDRSLHNIRLSFRVEGLWELFHRVVVGDIGNSIPIADIAYHNSKSIPILRMNNKSKDIVMSTSRINNLLIGMTVHKTDTVSVTVACSLSPVAINTEGLFNLASALTRSEERLRLMVEGMSKHSNHVSNTSTGKTDIQTLTVPSYENEQDSNYLALASHIEREIGEVRGTIETVSKFVFITERLSDLKINIDAFSQEEIKVRTEIHALKEKLAENRSILDKFKDLLMDTLLRMGVKDIDSSHTITLDNRYCPEIVDKNSNSVLNFSNVGSGGTKEILNHLSQYPCIDL